MKQLMILLAALALFPMGNASAHDGMDMGDEHQCRCQ